MSNYLVTGAAGFIGSNIVRFLLERGHSVRGLDNFITGTRDNIAEVQDRIEFIEGDIRDPDIMDRASRDIDFILHQAALRSVPRSLDDPTMTNDNNITGTLQVLEAARKNRVRRVVYASSSSVYGDKEAQYKTETQIPSPMSPYAVSKLTGEYYCQVYTICYGQETVSLRYFNVFGPRQDPMSKYSAVIPLFIHAVTNDMSPIIYGDGYQSRDFTYVENVCSANYLASTSPRVGRGDVCNVACGTNFDLHQILNMIKEWAGKPDILPQFEPPRKGDVRRSQADITKAEELLGYSVLVPFEEGLQRTFEWFKQHPYPFFGSPKD